MRAKHHCPGNVVYDTPYCMMVIAMKTWLLQMGCCGQGLNFENSKHSMIVSDSSEFQN